MAPAFIFVDPYGFKVPGDLLGELLNAGRVELFLNVIWRELDMAIRQQRDSGHGLAIALDAIFAGDDWRRIEGETPNERMNQAVELLGNRIGARWHTYIRMTSGGTATGAALFRRMLSHSFIRVYARGGSLFGARWPGTASGQRLHALLSGSRSA